MSNEQFREIEIKVQIENSTNLAEFLKDRARFIASEHQVDTYYTPAHRDFLSVDPVVEWLRLRDSDGKYSLNYKRWHYDENGRSHYSDEYETPIENLEAAERILEALDMRMLTKVDKERNTWIFEDYEIALDEVKDLGDFVEVEYKGQGLDRKPEEITNEMVLFLKSLNCGKILRNYRGYPYLLLFPGQGKEEEF